MFEKLSIRFEYSVLVSLRVWKQSKMQTATKKCFKSHQDGPIVDYCNDESRLTLFPCV